MKIRETFLMAYNYETIIITIIYVRTYRTGVVERERVRWEQKPVRKRDQIVEDIEEERNFCEA